MGKHRLHIPGNQSGIGLFVYLRNIGVPITADCGGNGICGKCAVEIIKGDFPFADGTCTAKAGDVVPACKLLCPPSGGEIKVKNRGAVTTPLLYPDARRSARQSCTAVPRFSTTIESTPHSSPLSPHVSYDSCLQPSAFDLAIDVGTTTIEAALVDSVSGQVIQNASCLNPQRTYGADVISRISASETHLNEMSAAVRSACAQLMHVLIDGTSRNLPKPSKTSSVRRICFVGNPTMMHILRSVSPAGMGTYPFTMAFTGEVREPTAQYGITADEAIFPTASSAFIGSDTTCGAIAAGIDDEASPALYIDAGTNGEMVLFTGRKNGSRFIATSAAAGPALEGARITYGTGGVDGAICAFSRNSGGKTHVNTIGNKPPHGICGSGLVDIIADLLDEHIIDSSGYMTDGRYIIPGGAGAYITQQDIREFQLAKSAIRAGIETLLCETDTTKEAICKVFLAGNLGKYMNIASAISTGIIPPEFAGRIVQCGNGALNGAAAYLVDDSSRSRVMESASKYRTLELNNSHFFEKEFIRHMSF